MPLTFGGMFTAQEFWQFILCKLYSGLHTIGGCTSHIPQQTPHMGLHIPYSNPSAWQLKDQVFTKCTAHNQHASHSSQGLLWKFSSSTESWQLLDKSKATGESGEPTMKLNHWISYQRPPNKVVQHLAILTQPTCKRQN